MGGHVDIRHGDALDVLRSLPAGSMTACITDAPYGLSREPDMADVLRHWLAGDDYQHRGAGFYGNAWDSFVPGPAVWREVHRVLKPGGALLTFAGTRTCDLMGVAIRLAGFERRDTIRVETGASPPAEFAWMHSEGFPKSRDVSADIDRAAGAERAVRGLRATGKGNGGTGNDFVGGARASTVAVTAPATVDAQRWEGWGTALKPSFEPVIVARKPLDGTTAANIVAHGAGGMNIDANRVEGRWPTNTLLVHDPGCDVTCSQGCPVAGIETCSPGASTYFPAFRYAGKAGARERPSYIGPACFSNERCPQIVDSMHPSEWPAWAHDPNGTCPQCGTPCAPITHSTVKPLDLARWLVRLVVPQGGTFVDPFVGSGTFAEAAVAEGVDAVVCDKVGAHIPLIEQRVQRGGRVGAAARRRVVAIGEQPDLFTDLAS